MTCDVSPFFRNTWLGGTLDDKKVLSWLNGEPASYTLWAKNKPSSVSEIHIEIYFSILLKKGFYLVLILNIFLNLKRHEFVFVVGFTVPGHEW